MSGSALPEHTRLRLSAIEPSHDGALAYYPVRAVLKSGEILDTVYIVPEKPYLKYWGVYPEADKGKRWIRIEDVAEVEDSPMRLPAKFANELYRNGESGMGYTIFTVVFANGFRQSMCHWQRCRFRPLPSGQEPEGRGRRDPA